MLVLLKPELHSQASLKTWALESLHKVQGLFESQELQPVLQILKQLDPEIKYPVLHIQVFPLATAFVSMHWVHREASEHTAHKLVQYLQGVPQYPVLQTQVNPCGLALGSTQELHAFISQLEHTEGQESQVLEVVRKCPVSHVHEPPLIYELIGQLSHLVNDEQTRHTSPHTLHVEVVVSR